MATAALQGLAGGNIGGALAGASAPELAHLLKSTEGDPAVNAIAHAILGGAVAALQGNSAAAGAAGAASGELIARAIAEIYYPGVKASDLTEDQRQTISSLASISAGIAGGLVRGDTSGAATGAGAGKNAVENNALSVKENQSRVQEMSQCQGNKSCEGAVTEKYKQISAEQRKSVVECTGAQNCVDKANEVSKLQADYANRANELLEKARANGSLSPEEQNELSILQVTAIQLEADRNAAIHNALMSGDSSEAKQLAINSLAQAIGTSAAGIAAGIGKGKGSAMPVPIPTKADNGLIYQSNPKHTPGQPSNRPNAGVEPQDSLKLFEQSIPSTKQYPNKEVRFAVDSQGNVHRFVGTNGLC